jgi:hypothetical protein
MKTGIKLALLMLPTLALSQERVLPDDVLIDGKTQILVVKQLTPTTYEFQQLAAPPGATPGNAGVLCAGSALAHMKGYPGLSVGAVDDGIPSGAKFSLTVALLKAPAEVAALPTTNLKWLPYIDIKTLRQRCSQFIQAKYLWPAN